jgi:hypothetical protein
MSFYKFNNMKRPNHAVTQQSVSYLNKNVRYTLYRNGGHTLTQMNEYSASHRNADATVERALSYAFRLIGKMEQSSPGSQFIFVTDVVVWAIERLNPSLVTALRDTGQFDDFRRCLTLYGTLRPSAEELRYQAYLDACAEDSMAWPDDGHVTAEDMLCALEHGPICLAETPQRALFERAIRAISSRPQRALSRESVRGRLPAVVHSYAIESELDAHMPDYDVAQTPPYMMKAMLHARRELILFDDGAHSEFWEKTYPSIVGDWLEMDIPEVAASILSAGEVSDYFADVRGFLTEMRTVERIWAGVSYPVRALLLRCPDEHEAIEIVKKIVRAGDTDEADVSRRSSLVWSMIRRREATEIFPATKVDRSAGTNEYIDRLRAAPAATETCFVVDKHALPVEAAAVIAEKTALVVRLPESSLDNVDMLGRDGDLRPFFSERGKPGTVRCELAMSPAFWCQHKQLWPVVFAFRRSIPVLYVFDDSLVVCQYAFCHFCDLRYIADLSPKQYLTTIVDEDGTISYPGPSGWSRYRPSLLTDVLNEASYRNVGALSKTYLAESVSTAQ